MNIILTGFMGTGKTAVGKRLAKRLGWRFIDIDQLIEAGAKMPIARIFSERGESVFRRLERRCILRAVHGQHHVIATGGGAFVDPSNRARLRVTGSVICLTARPDVIISRIGRKLETRPMLAGRAGPIARIRALLAARAEAYAQADLTIDTSELSVEQVVEQLWRKLGPCLCPSWQYLQDHAQELGQRYGGKYVVVIGNRIIASGQTQLEAYRNAPEQLAEKRDAGVYYVPLPQESVTAL